MAKSLVLGNGKILICYDNRAQVRDFYYPYVGLENHVGTWRVIQVGVWTTAGMRWFADPSWQISIDYRPETFGAEIVARNDVLNVTLTLRDIVYNEKDILVRKVTVENRSNEERVIKVFFNQQFQISETHDATTAFYDPDSQAIVHYKGRRVFLIGGMHSGKPFDEWSIGLLKVEGKEGTWKDAEDGKLSGNSIEHGSVDSVIGFTLRIRAGGKDSFAYWITVAETIGGTRSLVRYILERTPEHLIETTENFWRAWVNKLEFSFYGLSQRVVELFKKSLFVIRAHADNHGAMIASGDSNIFQYGRDTYCYMWPRDGAFAALALDRAGYADIAKRFFEFCNDVITEEGYLLHKYRPDRSLGSSWHPWFAEGKKRLAIQEDETALVLWALWEYYKSNKDLEFIEAIYNTFIKRAGDFMVSYRDKRSGLPAESYDLWEERYSVSTFTAAGVFGALSAAAKFSTLLGKEEDAENFSHTAEDLRRGILTHLLNSNNRYFLKGLKPTAAGSKTDDTVDASSFYGIFRFGVLQPTDEYFRSASQVVVSTLRSGEGHGIGRYLGDRYYRMPHLEAGNPWFVTTLWLCEYQISQARAEADLEDVKRVFEWVADRSSPAGMLSEQLDASSGTQVSVSPLAWSHAQFVLTVIAYLLKLEELGICKACYKR